MPQASEAWKPLQKNCSWHHWMSQRCREAEHLKHLHQESLAQGGTGSFPTPCVQIPSEEKETFEVDVDLWTRHSVLPLCSHYIVLIQRKGCINILEKLYFKYLESEVSTRKGDGVEVNARLQVVGTQHGDTLIESSLYKNKEIIIAIDYSFFSKQERHFHYQQKPWSILLLISETIIQPILNTFRTQPVFKYQRYHWSTDMSEDFINHSHWW